MYMAALNISPILAQTLLCWTELVCVVFFSEAVFDWPLRLCVLTGRLQEASGVCHGQTSAGAFALTQTLWLKRFCNCNITKERRLSTPFFQLPVRRFLFQSVRFFPPVHLNEVFNCEISFSTYDDEFSCILDAKCRGEHQVLSLKAIVFSCSFWTVAAAFASWKIMIFLPSDIVIHST